MRAPVRGITCPLKNNKIYALYSDDDVPWNDNGGTSWPVRVRSVSTALIERETGTGTYSG